MAPVAVTLDRTARAITRVPHQPRRRRRSRSKPNPKLKKGATVAGDSQVQSKGREAGRVQSQPEAPGLTADPPMLESSDTMAAARPHWPIPQPDDRPFHFGIGLFDGQRKAAALKRRQAVQARIAEMEAKRQARRARLNLNVGGKVVAERVLPDDWHKVRDEPSPESKPTKKKPPPSEDGMHTWEVRRVECVGVCVSESKQHTVCVCVCVCVSGNVSRPPPLSLAHAFPAHTCWCACLLFCSCGPCRIIRLVW